MRSHPSYPRRGLQLDSSPFTPSTGLQSLHSFTAGFQSVHTFYRVAVVALLHSWIPVRSHLLQDCSRCTPSQLDSSPFTPSTGCSRCTPSQLDSSPFTASTGLQSLHTFTAGSQSVHSFYRIAVVSHLDRLDSSPFTTFNAGFQSRHTSTR
jgi:hypothetical protein